MQQARRLRAESLDAAKTQRRGQKEQKAHPDRRQSQKTQGRVACARAGLAAGLRVGGAHDAEHADRLAGEQVAMAPDHHPSHQGEQTGAGDRRAPVDQFGDADQKDRRQRPAEAAGDAVHRVGARQSGWRDARIQDGIVDRMKRRIAKAGQHAADHQHRIARRTRQGQGGQHKRGERAQHDRDRADSIDHEAGECLANTRDDEEHRHQQTELRIAQIELDFQPRKERRDDQVKEVRAAMGNRDHRDGAGFALARVGQAMFGQGGGGGTHGRMLGKRRGRSARSACRGRLRSEQHLLDRKAQGASPCEQ